MINAALEAAWTSRLSRVELAVHAGNLPAITLYERTGFLREGLMRNAVLIDGRFIDTIAMAIINA